jgi:hypothetical protein
VFLAVHQEMRLIRRSFQTNQSEERSQNQLLREFLRDDPSGRVIFPILGEPGIGKSHLVRWLDVHLRQRDDHNRRHVIRIPKSSSLKSVLGRILSGLEGPRYEKIRDQLQSAREQMDDISAKQRIRAELLTAIEHKYNAAKERQARAKMSGDAVSKQDSLWIGHGDPRALPALFKDPATEVLFMTGTKSRPGIISELARHITKDTSEADTPRREFEEADFLIPNELAESVKEAGVIAGRYLEKLQRTTSAKALEEAVGLLNEIVDDAIKPLATPTDTSLSDLFFEVRKRLLEDDRELVLLIEDFSVLAGVQQALFDAMNREAEYDGKKTACTIRTALAVTTGYFEKIDTSRSRAVHSWWIECGENEEEDEVYNQIGNFVAAYVNAARIGAKLLEKHYQDHTNVSKKAPNALEFLGLEEDEIGLLAQFGQSADAYSLFPFNQSAICTIADWRLRDQSGRLKFHPRSIINEIILPVVKDARISFERGAFPPEMFLGYPKTRISADLSADVSQKEGNALRRDQYLYLLHFWAGQPERLVEAQLQEGVYIAFGLPVLDGNTTTVAPSPLKPRASSGLVEGGDTPTIQKVSGEPVAEKEPPAIRQFIDKINEWRGGAVLEQADANRIRGWINTHIMYSINWEAELLNSIKPATDSYATSIYLPRAKGNRRDVETAFVVVAEDSRFDDASVANAIFSAIRAMLRYDHFKTWDYRQADEDYIALTNFVDRHLSQATHWIRARYKNLDGPAVAALTQSLLWQARLLDVETAHKADDASLIDAVFAPSPKSGERDEDQEWNDFLDDMANHRHLLRNELLAQVGAFQGSGKVPYAIDASQMMSAVREIRKSWIITERFPRTTASAIDELKQIDTHVSSLIRFGVAKIEDRRRRIADQSKLIVAELGKDYDKNKLLDDLQEVCSLAEQHGLKGDVPVGQIRKLAEQFKDARAKEVGGQVEAIVASDDLGVRMSAIAKLDICTHTLLVAFADTCSRFVKERAGKAENKIVQWTEEVVELKKAHVDAILQELEEAVRLYGKLDT